MQIVKYLIFFFRAKENNTNVQNVFNEAKPFDKILLIICRRDYCKIFTIEKTFVNVNDLMIERHTGTNVFLRILFSLRKHASFSSHSSLHEYF